MDVDGEFRQTDEWVSAQVLVHVERSSHVGRLLMLDRSRCCSKSKNHKKDMAKRVKTFFGADYHAGCSLCLKTFGLFTTVPEF